MHGRHQKVTNFLLIVIKHCLFSLNTQFSFYFINIQGLYLTNNTFHNNTAQSPDAVLQCGLTRVILKQYNEFSFNNANAIISLQRYILLTEGATLNISHNRAISRDKKFRSLIMAYYYSSICIFQFHTLQESLDKHKQLLNFSLVFMNNENYASVLYGRILNSCKWIQNSAFNHSTPGDIYKKVIHYDMKRNIIERQRATLCYCDRVTKEIDCFRDNFTSIPIYPGQTIPMNLIQMPKYQPTVIYQRKDSITFGFLHLFKPCRLKSQKSSESLQFIPFNCTQLYYKALTASLKPCSIVFSAVGFITGTSTLYDYYISFKTCPSGIELQSESCNCNKRLQAAFTTLAYDIDTQTFNVPGKGWIGYTYKR